MLVHSAATVVLLGDVRAESKFRHRHWSPSYRQGRMDLLNSRCLLLVIIVGVSHQCLARLTHPGGVAVGIPRHKQSASGLQWKIRDSNRAQSPDQWATQANGFQRRTSPNEGIGEQARRSSRRATPRTILASLLSAPGLRKSPAANVAVGERSPADTWRTTRWQQASKRFQNSLDVAKVRQRRSPRRMPDKLSPMEAAAWALKKVVRPVLKRFVKEYAIMPLRAKVQPPDGGDPLGAIAKLMDIVEGIIMDIIDSIFQRIEVVLIEHERRKTGRAG